MWTSGIIEFCNNYDHFFLLIVSIHILNLFFISAVKMRLARS